MHGDPSAGHGRSACSSSPESDSEDVDTSTRNKVNLEECLQLLQGPSDERRFVGLLMVTRALSPDDDTIRRVFEAIGTNFLTRLLIPLKQNYSIPGYPLVIEEAQKLVVTASLGISVLCSLVRVEDVAGDDSVIALLPLLLSTVSHGGISPLISVHCQETLAYNEGQVDSNAVKDALESLVAITLASEYGHHVAIQSGSLRAAATAIAVVHDILKKEHHNQYPWIEVLLWIVRFVNAIVSKAGNCFENSCEEMKDNDIEHLLDGISWIFSLPMWMMKMNKNFSFVNIINEDDISDEESSKETRGRTVIEREKLARSIALAHIESMQTLVLLLQSIQWNQTGLHINEYQTENHRDLETLQSTSGEYKDSNLTRRWPEYVRQGVEAALRGKPGQTQKHVALHLCSLMVQIAGPLWLCYNPKIKLDYESNSIDGIDLFFLLVLENTKVEIVVRMHDALEPGAKIETSLGELKIEDPIRQSNPSERFQVYGLGPDNQTSGQRCLQELPVLFSLFEAQVEAIALQSTLEKMILGSDAIRKALRSLHESSDVLLQYLEITLNEEEFCGRSLMQNGFATDFQNHVQIGVVRALSRFLGELPDAFADRICKLLPKLLGISLKDPSKVFDRLNYSSTNGEISSIHFLIPLLLQVTDSDRDLVDPEADASKWCLRFVESNSLSLIVNYVDMVARTMINIDITKDIESKTLHGILTEFTNASRLLLQICLWRKKKVVEDGSRTIMCIDGTLGDKKSFTSHQKVLVIFRKSLEYLNDIFLAERKSQENLADPTFQDAANTCVLNVTEGIIICGRLIAAILLDEHFKGHSTLSSDVDVSQKGKMLLEVREEEEKARHALAASLPKVQLLLSKDHNEGEGISKYRSIFDIYDYKDLKEKQLASLVKEFNEIR